MTKKLGKIRLWIGPAVRFGLLIKTGRVANNSEEHLIN